VAKQTFVSAQVLTAAQMTTLQANDYNQTVSTKTASYTLIASDAGTKVVMNSASATTITVNTSLFTAGDNLTILNIGAGVCTVTAGTATVSTTGTLALVQNAGGTLYFTSAGVSVFQANGVSAPASGLTLITAQTIGTAVATVTVSNCFSSTYDNYWITVNGGVGSANPTYFALQMGATVTGYYSFDIYGNYTSNTVNGFARANVAQFAALGVGSTGVLDSQIVIKNPNLAKITTFISDSAVPATGVDNWAHGIGFLNNTTQYTAFTILVSGTFTGGTVRVYGYQNS